MRAWVLNLDAEMELEAGRRYTPGAAIEARTRALASSVAIPSDDRLVGRDSIEECTRGRAWCPTPRALALLGTLAVDPVPPSFEILRRVNERGFAHALSEGELSGALRATSIDAIEAHVARPGATGAWLMKRAFGVAGRGQRPIAPGPISLDDRRWIEASLRRDALYVEPRVDITRELSMHGWAIDHVEVRSIRAQTLRDRAWVASEPARDLAPAIERELLEAAERVGAALIDAGYRGPFGVDAYVWGTGALRTISEVNARYCMGWDDRDGWDPP